MGRKKKRGGAKNDARGYATTAVAPKAIPKSVDTDLPVKNSENDATTTTTTSTATTTTTTDNVSIASQPPPPVIPKRFYKRVEMVYLLLSTKVGFSDAQIETIVSNVAAEQQEQGQPNTNNMEFSLESALNWACLHFETQDLPPLLTEGYVREKQEDQKQDSSHSGSNLQLEVVTPLSSSSAAAVDDNANVLVDLRSSSVSPNPTTAMAKSPRQEGSERQSAPDESAKAWILSQYQYDEDEHGDEENHDGAGKPTQDDNVEREQDSISSPQLLPEQVELQKIQLQVGELQATLQDDASNYMRSKAEIKQLQKELAQLKKKASKWNAKVAKAVAAKKAEEAAEKAAEGEEDAQDNGIDDDENNEGGMFGMFEEEQEQATDITTTTLAHESSTKKNIETVGEDEAKDDKDLFILSSTESSIPDSWTGKTPKQILEEHCRKQGMPRPTFSKFSNKKGCSATIRFKHTDPRLPLKVEQEGPFYSYNDAQQYVSTQALWELTGPDHLPLYRLFPPVFASLWKSWMEQQEEQQQSQNDASRAELDGKVRALIDLLPKSLWLASVGMDEKKAETTFISSTPAEAGSEQIAERGEQVKLADKRRRDTTQHVCQEFSERRRTPEYKIMMASRSKLPMNEYREELLEMIEKNPVSILCAETGAGKTTQCPQFLLEQALFLSEDNNNNTTSSNNTTNILCTQPRRVAAMSVADRVAEEMCEPRGVGGLVGYQIRMESKMSSRTRLLFCTTGVVLRRLQDDPTLQGVTHVLVDEVHERQWQIDFLLITLRRLIETTRPDLKVVLMSATLDVKLFGSFFGGMVPVLSVPGRTFPVANYFLEDLLDATNHIIEADSRYAIRGATSTFQTETLWVTTKGGEKRREVASLESQMDVSEVSGLYPGYKMSTQRSMDRVDEKVINYDLIEDVLLLLVDPNNGILVPPESPADVSAHNNKDGAILIFLPGLGEIRAMSDRLQGNRVLGNRHRFDVIPLHSTLSPQDQKRAFRLPPEGIRKIILSTNIAETSVTISDVVAVIDCGLVREIRQDKRYATNKLVLDWCSRASTKQRGGRAGRVQAGICCKLFSSLTLKEKMREQAIPELQRVPLEEVCLNILAGKLATNCATFLQQAPQPPSETSVNLALTLLKEVGALDVVASSSGAVVDSGEKLTPLGHHLAKLPCEPRLGKMLIFGALFSCLDKILTIAASLGVKSPFSTAFGNNETQATAKHRRFQHERSDFFTFCNVWEEFCQNQGRDRGRRYCYEHFLNWTALVEISDSRKQYLELLAQLGFASGYNRQGIKDPDEWLKTTIKTSNTNFCQHSANHNLVHAVVCAGLYPNVARVEHHVTDVPALWHKTERLYFHSASTNRNQRLHRGIEDWMLFHEKFATSRRTTVSATAPVLPSAILLFGGDIVINYMERKATIDEWISLPMAAQTAVRFCELRKRLDQVLLQRLKQNNDDGESEIIDDIVQLLQDSMEATVQRLMTMKLATGINTIPTK